MHSLLLWLDDGRGRSTQKDRDTVKSVTIDGPRSDGDGFPVMKGVCVLVRASKG